jgi:glycosyltransferase involved in cell wall biosynthesis
MQTVVEEKASSNPGQRSPAISVVMPVYNALPYLDESISSILNQTFTDFEFVILDDGSTDGSIRRLREWAREDARIRLYESNERLGLSGISNRVIEKARAPLIARMDADDISHTERLMKQWEVMASRPDVALVGTLFEGIDDCGRRVRGRDRWRLARKTWFAPFPHGSVMFRREIFEEVGGYHEACESWEDQDLFLRIRQRGRAVVITDALYYYRFHTGNVTSSRALEQVLQAYSLRRRCLEELRQGNDYTPLLSEREQNDYHTEAELLDALYLQGCLRLWAGKSPQILKQLLRHKSLSLAPRPLKTLVWAAWGSVSPKSLRFCLRSIIRGRDRLAGYRVKDGGIHEWRLE